MKRFFALAVIAMLGGTIHLRLAAQEKSSGSGPSGSGTVAGGSATSPQNSRNPSFRELPVAVQNAVRGQAGSARIEEIKIIPGNGQTNYTVAFKQDGKPVQLLLDGHGRLLSGAQSLAQAQTEARAPLSAVSKVTLEQLPAAVQSTLRTYAQGARIEDIDKGTLQGQTVFQAAFKQQGQNVELRVAQDGSLVKDTVNARFLARGKRPARE